MSDFYNNLEISDRTRIALDAFLERCEPTDDRIVLLRGAVREGTLKPYLKPKQYSEVVTALAMLNIVMGAGFKPREVEPPHMRDAFAAAALNGMIANGHGGSEDDLAVCAYQFADAMIKARAPKSQPTPEQVKSLRELTGAGLMECKKALIETDCDIEAAERYLNRR